MTDANEDRQDVLSTADLDADGPWPSHHGDVPAEDSLTPEALEDWMEGPLGATDELLHMTDEEHERRRW